MTAATAPHPPKAGRVLPTMNEDGSRRWIRPKPARGKWYSRRQVVAYGLMAFFFIAPFVRVAGRPLFLIDLPRRHFTVFAYTFLPTDTLALMFFLGTLIISIFLMTALFGRVWCGWACPQTVFLEFLFRPIEQLFEGGYTGSRRLDADRVWFNPRRVAKYATYAVLAAFVSHTFLAFFVGTDNLYRWVLNPPSQHPTAFFFVVLASGLIWFNFTWFREQTCLIVCPYGRWQSALVDRQSLMVVYDPRRGEPRELGVKNRDPGAGDCIDCKACLQTCPMGIDIRNGWQMECVNCTQCIDSCDAVMSRIGKPEGLIRYASLAEVTGEAHRLLRVRTVFYPAVLVILATGLILTLALKAPADITVLRGLSGPFTEQADGRISNQIRVKISNRTAVEQSYRISVSGLPDAATIVAPENPLTVAAGETRMTSVFVVLPPNAFTNGERVAQLSVTDRDGYTDRESYRLLGPSGASR